MQPDETVTPTAPIPEASKRRPLSWREKVVFIVIGCMLLTLFGEGYYRAEYGNYSPWSVPARFNHCGMGYYQTPGTSPDNGLIVTKAQALSGTGTKQLVFLFNLGTVFRTLSLIHI